MTNLDWHAAFYAYLQIELAKYSDVLEFYPEHQLTAGQLRIDVVVIKKKADTVIDNELFRIFREVNIIEYKSPDDQFNEWNYEKTLAYCHLYSSLNEVWTNDITLSIVVMNKPKGLFERLKKNYTITQQVPGVYYVNECGVITQFIVENELLPETNILLQGLKKSKITEGVAENIVRKVCVSDNRRFINAYMDVFSAIHDDIIREMKKKMATTFAGLMEEIGITDIFVERGKAEGKAETIKEIVQRLHKKGHSDIEISELLDLPIEELKWQKKDKTKKKNNLT